MNGQLVQDQVDFAGFPPGLTGGCQEYVRRIEPQTSYTVPRCNTGLVRMDSRLLFDLSIRVDVLLPSVLTE